VVVVEGHQRLAVANAAFAGLVVRKNTR
jgi:hypothetical protein